MVQRGPGLLCQTQVLKDHLGTPSVLRAQHLEEHPGLSPATHTSGFRNLVRARDWSLGQGRMAAPLPRRLRLDGSAHRDRFHSEKGFILLFRGLFTTTSVMLHTSPRRKQENSITPHER